MDALTVLVLVIATTFIFAGLLLAVLFAIVAFISAADSGAHDDLLLDGEDFERKNNRNFSRRA
jgi:hypothetical protein